MRPRPLARSRLARSIARAAVVSSAALTAGIALVAAPITAPIANAAPTAPPPSATVALLATRPGSTKTTLHLVPLGSEVAGPPVASLTHLPDATVRASVIPGAPVVIVTADATPARDPSFNAALYRIAPLAEPALLCDRVVHASRPLVTAAGRVFVSRGVAGPEPSPGDDGAAALRVDALTIDEIDPASGAARTVHAHRGHLAFLAGSWRRELLVYRVSPAGADLVAIDPDSGAVRIVARSIPPFARDFSIDEASGALVFEDRHESDARTWVVDRIDLASGKRSRLATSASVALAPYAWPRGGLAYTPDRSAGLTVRGARLGVKGPLGPGVDAIQATSPDGAWAAALHTNPDVFAVPFAIRADTGAVAAIPAPPGARIAIAGFVTAKGAPR